MSEFIFMLTRDDATVEDCLDVYEQVRSCDVRWVGFKDIGVPLATLKELTRRIRSDGRQVVLEIVSTDPAAELASVRAGVELGVDVLMGGTQPDAALAPLSGTGIRYFPFPGTVVGHPSVLEGTQESIAKSAWELTRREGVDGLDLLAYRWVGDVPALVSAVVNASAGPVIVAGSITTAEQIGVASWGGAWGFTIGGAVLDRVLVPGGSLVDQVTWVLETTAAARRQDAPA